MKNYIFEGARGTGKTTQARNVRHKISEITLVNATGFHTDGKEGFSRIFDYYDSWLRFIISLDEHESTFVFDRFFFTEQVFSKLYKEYDFSDAYKAFLKKLVAYSDTTVLFFTISDEEELKQRLTRDKVPFAKVEESVEQTLNQQNEYRALLKEAQDRYGLEVIEIDTTGKTSEQIEEEVLKIVGGN